MQTPLILTTFFMGLAGGPHCIAMCGAACSGIQQSQSSKYNALQFQAGRLIGYSSLGAIAAGSVQSLAWFSSQTLALHPLWTFFHVLVLSWGLMLLSFARQPMWADNVGRQVWKHIRQFTQLKGGVFATGMMWAFMPCGLLYSALLIASLNASPLNGALSMATFALGTSISLIVGPWVWLKLKRGGKFVSENTSMRIAGFLLSAIAGWAIWMDLTKSVRVWCN
ncbi:MAG: sulfite exporter TauE/SafE family protein [Pseudomonadota bacterium]